MHSKCITIVTCKEKESISEAIFKSEWVTLYKNFLMCWTFWLFKKIPPSPKPNCIQSFTSLLGASFSHKGINVRRSCSTQLLLFEICKCKSLPVKLSAGDQLSSNTNSSFLTVISSKWSYPSGVYYNFFMFLHFSFINHCLTWISFNFLHSNVCHLYPFRINGFSVVFFR